MEEPDQEYVIWLLIQGGVFGVLYFKISFPA